MGGFWGSHLGVIDLMLERDGGTWKVVNTAVETRPIYKRNEDRSITADGRKRARDRGRGAGPSTRRRWPMSGAPVGKTSAPLQSYFALVADDPSRADRQPGADLVHRRR